MYKNIFKTTCIYLGIRTSFLINNGCVFVADFAGIHGTKATALSYYETYKQTHQRKKN